MPDYIKFDPLTKRIIERWISIDPSKVEGYENILQVTRAVVEGITKFHKVENGEVVLMTQAEQDALLAEETQAIIDQENARILDLDNLMQTDLSSITLAKVDTAIDNIGNLNDAKVFLKKLCRYIIKFISRQ